MSNELEHSLNPYGQVSRSKRASFYNELIVEILADNLEELYYEIKYHYFNVNFIGQEESHRPLRVLNEIDVKQRVKNISIESSQPMFSCQLSRGKNNQTIEVRLDNKMMCDNEVDCIYNSEDELNCEFCQFHFDKGLNTYFVCFIFKFYH